MIPSWPFLGGWAADAWTASDTARGNRRILLYRDILCEAKYGFKIILQSGRLLRTFNDTMTGEILVSGNGKAQLSGMFPLSHQGSSSFFVALSAQIIYYRTDTSCPPCPTACFSFHLVCEQSPVCTPQRKFIRFVSYKK